MAGQASVVGPIAERHSHLGRDQDPVASALEGLAQDFLRLAAGILVRRVKEVDASLQALVDLTARLVHTGRTDRRELPAAAERHGAHGKHRYPQA